jgi:Ala-tRNA(Pro) deacylase
MPAQQLKEFLDQNNVKYVAITHSTAYTTQEIAALTHTKGKNLAKTVIIKIDGRLAMTVLPACYQVDLGLLRESTGAKTIALAGEPEFRAQFPGCETGAMPPFGNLYNMDVFADLTLARNREIAFNAGSHKELIRLDYEDFARLAKPKLIRLAALGGARAA